MLLKRLNDSLRYRYNRIFRPHLLPPMDLKMVWPKGRVPAIPSLSDDYRIETFHEKDLPEYLRLLDECDMGAFNYDYWKEHWLENGFFVIKSASSELAATCFASKIPDGRKGFKGNLGYLAVSPRHRGAKLGVIVASLVTEKLQLEDLDEVYLTTQDFRIAAISLYLRMGWIPSIESEIMLSRWVDIYKKNDWDLSTLNSLFKDESI